MEQTVGICIIRLLQFFTGPAPSSSTFIFFERVLAAILCFESILFYLKSILFKK